MCVSSIVRQFRVRYDCWIKEMKTHFLQAQPPSEVNIFTNSNENKTCLPLCLLLYIFKFQTLTCRNFWICYFKSRLTLYVMVFFNLALKSNDLFRHSWNNFLQQFWLRNSCYTYFHISMYCNASAWFLPPVNSHYSILLLNSIYAAALFKVSYYDSLS